MKLDTVDSKSEELRRLLKSETIIIAPGVYDGLSARVVAESGFKAAYMTGHGVSVSLINKSDVGLTTMSEVIQQAKNIANSINIPLIADVDTGYGSVLNVQRTVQEAYIAGVAAVQIEDQEWPKKCGHMPGKRIISKSAMVGKIKAAKAVCPNMIIVARTDAIAITGLEDAIDRLKAYKEAGAEVLFADAIPSVDDMKKIVHSNIGPLLANMVEDGMTPELSAKELSEMGFKVVIFPLSLMYMAAKSMLDVCHELKLKGTTRDLKKNMLTFPEFNKLMGVEKYYHIEKLYGNE